MLYRSKRRVWQPEAFDTPRGPECSTFIPGGGGGGGGSSSSSSLGLTPPSSPASEDDEFDATGLSGWSTWDPGSIFGTAPTVVTGSNGLELRPDDPGAKTVGGIYKAAPSGDFSLHAFVSMSNPNKSDYSCGVMVAGDLASSPTTAGARAGVVFGSGVTSGNQPGYQAWTNYGSAGAFAARTASRINGYWVRLRYDDTLTQFAVEHSLDGLTWIATQTATSVGFTPSYIGLCCHNNSAVNDALIRVRGFRVLSSIDFDDPVPSADYE